MLVSIPVIVHRVLLTSLWPFVAPAHFLFPHCHGPAVLTTVLSCHHKQEQLRGSVVNRLLLVELGGRNYIFQMPGSLDLPRIASRDTKHLIKSILGIFFMIKNKLTPLPRNDQTLLH